MGYQVHRYNHQSPEEKFLRILWAVISWPFKLIFGKKSDAGTSRTEGIDRGFIETKWREIEELMKLGRPSNFSRAVLEADKMLDHLLKGHRLPGLTMGDRLKAGRQKFSKEAYNAAWQAHKVRNELVHNSQFELLDYHARETIANFKKAIDELM